MLTTDILTANDRMLMRLKYPETYDTTPPGYEIEYVVIEFYEEYLERNDLQHSDEELWWYFNEMFDEEWLEYI